MKFMSQSKTIGELNGVWAAAFKVALTLFFGAVIPLNVFYVATLHEHDKRISLVEEWKDKGARFTRDDGNALERACIARDSAQREWTHNQLDALKQEINSTIDRLQ